MKRVWEVISGKQASVGSAAMILATMVLTSRLLGLVRDRLLAARFAPDALGVYFAAFRLPNFIFELLVTGALTSAFIPVFTRFITQNKEKEGWRMASIVINISVIAFAVLAIPILIWAKEISRFLAPGFSQEQIAIMTTFSRIMIVCQVIPLLIGNFFTGILQSYNLFLMPALAPVVYNIGIIIGIVTLSPIIGLFAPVAGVGLGACLFMLIQLPTLLRVGYRHGLQIDVHNKGAREVGRLIGPRTFGLAASQVDSTIDLMMSSLLGARMVTIYTFAQNLQQVPIGLFGATVAQAALPTLSAASLKSDKGQFKHAVVSAIHQILFFIFPASVFFIILRIPLVRLIFGAARFDWQATYLTGLTLLAFSLSLFAQATVQVLARSFYALYDTKTPVIVGVVSIIINSTASLLFILVFHLPVWALGLSTSIASIVNACVLFILLDKKIGHFSIRSLVAGPIKMFLSSIVAGICIYIPLKLFDQLVFDTTRTFGLLLLTGIAGGTGLIVYMAMAWLFNIGEVKSFLDLLHRVRRGAPILLNPAVEAVGDSSQDKIS